VAVAVASAEPYANLHLAPDRYPCQHPTTQFFTGRMPFLPPNQQRQSTEGTAENVKQRSVACHLQLNMYRLLNIVSYSRFVEKHF